MKYWIVIVLVFMLCGCSQPGSENLDGLWQLEEVVVDAVYVKHNPTFLEIKNNHSFSVARRTGDLSGVYKANDKKIEMYSTDLRWFNTSWNYTCINGKVYLRGTESGFRGTKLRFKRIDVIPDFQEFEDRVVGTWQLYKVRSDQSIERLSETFFKIDTEGNYSMRDSNGILQSGKAVINTRHKKVIFERDDTIWNAWFYGHELRLSNAEIGIQYSLRKYDHNIVSVID